MQAKVSTAHVTRHNQDDSLLRAQGAVDTKRVDGGICGLSAKNKIQADKTGLENMRTSDTEPDVLA